MSKIYKIVFIVLITLFISNIKVFAVNTTCTYEEKANLNDIAGKITANYKIDETKEKYEFTNPDTGEKSIEEQINTKFIISIYNILDDVYIIQTNDVDSEEVSIHYDEATKGVYTFEANNTSDIIKYTYNIYSNLEGCRGEILKTFVFTKPKINMYSQYGICKGLEDTDFCQKYITEELNLTENGLYEKVQAMQKSTVKVKEKNNKEGISDFIIDNYIYLIIGTIVISGAVVGYIIVKKRRAL
ncbi:MAG: hypothetical protein PHD03_00110 [Bacilli bacterium]|nr:hypothetical protein [Bacilli bacterium]MDD4406435.1 hypothetical protein [Bacilli bacterium]